MYVRNGLVRQMQNRLLALSFRTWSFNAQKAILIHKVCGRMIRRMQNVNLSCAYNQWKATARGQLDVLEAVDEGMRWWTHRGLRCALRGCPLASM